MKQIYRSHCNDMTDGHPGGMDPAVGRYSDDPITVGYPAVDAILSKRTALPSRTQEFHPRALTDPYETVSRHTARATR